MVGTRTDEPVVTSYEPAARFRTIMRIGNAVMRPLLRSRIGARMPDLALLAFDGRRSGRHYEVPVGYHELAGRGVVLTASGWRANLRGGADIDVVHEGRRTRRRAGLIEDPDEVATIYGTLLERVGVAKAVRVGLRVHADRMPTHDELVDAIGGRRAVVLIEPPAH